MTNWMRALLGTPIGANHKNLEPEGWKPPRERSAIEPWATTTTRGAGNVECAGSSPCSSLVERTAGPMSRLLWRAR